MSSSRLTALFGNAAATAQISATRPLRHGVIADFEVTEQMLRHFMRKVLERRRAHPRLVVCAPSGITEVERRAVEEAALSAGARRAARGAWLRDRDAGADGRGRQLAPVLERWPATPTVARR